MKNLFFKKSLSITVAVSIIFTSVLFANPINVYASEDGIQDDIRIEEAAEEPETAVEVEAADEPEVAVEVETVEEPETVSEPEIASEPETANEPEIANEAATVDEPESANPALGEANGDPYPNNSQNAQEGYGENNENRAEPMTLDVVLGDGIRVLLTGLSNALVNNTSEKDGLINTIKDYLGMNDNNAGDPESIKNIENSVFVDAEKYSVNYDGYDSNYCWGATAANMLWLSGWGKELGYKNEDYIMSDLHDKFYDTAEEPEDAITWICDNYTSNVEIRTKSETSLSGKETSVCISEAIDSYKNVAGELNNIASLANVSSQATAIQCRWAKNGNVKEGSHWITAVGVVINETATNIVDYFKAIIFADSDDSAGTSGAAPSDNDASYNQRRDTVNSYKIGTLDTKTVNGVNYWYIPGYKDADGEGALITGIESLQNYSESLKSSLTERVGTKDVTRSIELISNGKTYAYGESASEPQSTFSTESTNIRISYTNASQVSVDNVQVPIRVKIYNQSNVELDSKVYYVSSDRINAKSKGYFDVNIDDITSTLGEGEFWVRVELNPQDAENKLEEAYYLNNAANSFRIKRVAKSSASDNNGNNSQESDYGSEDTDSEEVVNGETANEKAVNEEVVSEEAVEEAIKEVVLLNSKNELTIEDLAIIDKELEREGINKEAVKVIEQIFDQGQTTYFAPDTKIDSSKASDYKVFLAGNPKEFVSAEIDGVKLNLSELNIMRNSGNSYRVVLSGKYIKGLKKGKHKLVINSVRGALPIVIEITVM